MKIYQYKCTLLSDVVIAATAGTEGANQSLDYIPGAKFLGIVAGVLYAKEQKEAVLDLFHNGKVRFGDAHPYFDDDFGLKVPLKWFYPKGKDLTEQIYLHTEKLSPEILAKKQPKQARAGYFVKSGKLLQIEQGFSIKSAYDPIELRAKESQMYGYFSLKKGTEWVFIIKDTTGNYADKIKEILIGKKRVGRSRSAEYGLVSISFDKEINQKKKEISNGKTAYLYAKSNLCFYDSNGRTTIRPTPNQLNLPKGSKILWEFSQLKSRIYQTWNRKRYNRDADRMIVEKGSVFAVKLSQSLNNQQIENGVGFHQSEGFGELLVNPFFLQSETAELDFPLQKIKISDWVSSTSIAVVEKGAQDIVVLEYLSIQENAVTQVFDIDKRVNDFVENKKEFKGISSSQWGLVRNYAKHSSNNETLFTMLFGEAFGCLVRGQSEKDWRKHGRREKLQEYLRALPENSIIPFTIKLASQMAKTKENKYEKHN